MNAMREKDEGKSIEQSLTTFNQMGSETGFGDIAALQLIQELSEIMSKLDITQISINNSALANNLNGILEEDLNDARVEIKDNDVIVSRDKRKQ